MERFDGYTQMKAELLVHATTFEVPEMKSLLRTCIIGHAVRTLSGTYGEYLLVGQFNRELVVFVHSAMLTIL